MEQMAHALEKASPIIPQLRQYSINTKIRYEPTPEGDKPLRKLPPLVIPKEHPRATMQRYLTADQIDDIARLLEEFQKQGENWEAWKAKNWPSFLSERWAFCLSEIRKNGYVYPQAVNGKIVFSQILSRYRYRTSQCTLCGKRIDKGECQGSRASADDTGRNIKKGDFVPCWKVR